MIARDREPPRRAAGERDELAAVGVDVDARPRLGSDPERGFGDVDALVGQCGDRGEARAGGRVSELRMTCSMDRPAGAVARMRAMVTIGMNYQVLAGKEETFEAACRRVLEGMAERGRPRQLADLPQHRRRPAST